LTPIKAPYERRQRGGHTLKEPVMITRQIIAASVAALAFATAASAQSIHVTDTDTARQVKVSYGDLDLSHPAGAQVLIARVREAAGLACGEAPTLANLEQSQAYRACVVKTADGAIASLDAPIVSAMYQSKTRPELLAAR
jgi:UrcA family protein